MKAGRGELASLITQAELCATCRREVFHYRGKASNLRAHLEKMGIHSRVSVDHLVNLFVIVSKAICAVPQVLPMSMSREMFQGR